jgi:mannitol 2-dehydrogenase
MNRIHPKPEAATAIRPSLATLPALSATVSVPGYKRSDLSPGIVHIGVGNFHRAHMAVYLHRLFERGLDLDWAIIGGGVKQYDADMRAKLAPQDWLTTVIELDPEGRSATITGSMIDFAETRPDALVAALMQPEIRIVSLTITEGGYFLDALKGGFDSTHPDIIADALAPDAPETVFGVLIKALIARRDAGVAPFTVLSCDNLPENGLVARASVLGLAALQDSRQDSRQDSGHAAWIRDHVAFPNSMVDCITPATGPREIAFAAEHFAVADAAPVTCEPFRQWVLEDNFPQGRPRFELAGAEFVENVAPYELMKLRILNAGHAIIAYPSGILGIHYVHEAMANPLINRFLNWLLYKELMPTVPAIAGVDFEAYYGKIVERFSNAEVGDLIARLCLDGSNRQPKFILPAVHERLRDGLPVDGLALEVALWCRFCAGLDENSAAINVPDNNAAQLTDHALRARKNPNVFLQQKVIFGSLSEAKPFADAFAAALDDLWAHGVVRVLENRISGSTGG